MKNILITAICLLVMLSSCNKEDEKTIQPSTITNIVSTAGKGEIKLTWEKIEPVTFEVLKVEYYDPLLKQNVIRLASAYATGITLPNTRAKYGEYTITITPISSTKTEGTPIKITAVSAPAEITFTYEQIKLEEAMLSTNAQEPREGPIKNLIDNNTNTFFHTAWSKRISEMHYFQIELPEELAVRNFKYEYNLRTNNKSQGVKRIKVEASNDANNWITVVQNEEFKEPETVATSLISSLHQMETSYRYFRFTPLARFDQDPMTNTWFHMAEFRFFKANVYNPEKDD